MKKISRRQFVATAAVAGAAAVLPSGAFALQEDSTKPASPSVAKQLNREVVSQQAVPFPMNNVRLGPGPFRAAAEANRRYLKTLPPDRLLHTFRLTAGLPTSAEPLGDWEKPDCELRGHFAGGHYLSACAFAYASSGDEELKRNGDVMVAELAKCQAQFKNGYLSAFPPELFDRLRDGVNVWAPFYTIHKIMAGHLDMYLLTGNQQALETLEKMAQWVRSWADPLSEQQMQRVLLVEYGGMGEVLSNLYGVTGKREYLDLARRFDKKWFFDALAAHRDELKGLHVNTHIPQVIAAARLYELTGDKRYWNIADYFWDEVTNERSYCTGGTSNFELWRSEPGVLSTQLSSQTAEDCCAYNMMKLTRHLFSWSPRAAIHGLLRTCAVQSPHGNHRSGDGHNGLLPAARERLLQDLREAFRFVLVLQWHRRRGICEIDGHYLLPQRRFHLREPLYCVGGGMERKRLSPDARNFISRRARHYPAYLGSETRQYRFEAARPLLGEEWQRQGEWACGSRFR